MASAPNATQAEKPVSIPDQRMLKLMEEVIGKELQGIHTRGAFLKAIGAHPAYLYGVRHGKWPFTIHHLMAAAKLFNVSMDWLCGLTEARMPIAHTNVVRKRNKPLKPLSDAGLKADKNDLKVTLKKEVSFSEEGIK